MSKNESISNVSQICDSIDQLDNNVDKIEKKIEDITKIYYKLSNSSLEMGDTNSYLKFQIELLNVEKNYYSNIKKQIKTKFLKDLYTISESILMLLGSIDNIKIENIEEKNNILKKINNLKRNKSKFETSEILELMNSTIHNLELVNEFASIFDKYIKETIEKNNKENYHCNNFKVNLENKKDHIILEYNKFNHKLDELISYFLSLCNELSSQLKHQKILDFLVNKKES